MAHPVIEAEIRDQFGKNAARRYRKTGRIPTNLYQFGKGDKSQPVTVSAKELTTILNAAAGLSQLVDLKLEDKTASVIVKDVQSDPVTNRVLHADMIEVDPKMPIRVVVPILFEGVPEGVKQQGGKLDIVSHEVMCRCLPAKIPGSIAVNTESMLIGSVVRAGDLEFDDEVSLETHENAVLCHVVAKRGATAEELEAEAAAAVEGEEAAAAAEESGEAPSE